MKSKAQMSKPAQPHIVIPAKAGIQRGGAVKASVGIADQFDI